MEWVAPRPALGAHQSAPAPQPRRAGVALLLEAIQAAGQALVGPAAEQRVQQLRQGDAEVEQVGLHVALRWPASSVLRALLKLVPIQ